MNWRCGLRARIQGEKTLSCWNMPITGTLALLSTSGLTNSTAPEAAGRNPGFTLLRSRMITEACIEGATSRRVQNMGGTLPKSWGAHGPKAAASRHTSRKLCQVLAGKLFFRQDI